MADISQTESEEVNSDCNLLETRHKQYTKIQNEAPIASVETPLKKKKGIRKIYLMFCKSHYQSSKVDLGKIYESDDCPEKFH